MKVHFVKKARKAVPSAGVEVGQPYYWWKFRFQGRRVSKELPRRSQLTNSEFLSQVYDAEDLTLAGAVADFQQGGDVEDLASALEELAGEIEGWGSECEEKRSNMPESLQDSESGTLLQERAEACEELASELNEAANEIRGIEREEPDEPKEGEDSEDPEAEWRNNVVSRVEEVSWSF
jgi:hypothetical protein